MWDLKKLGAGVLLGALCHLGGSGAAPGQAKGSTAFFITIDGLQPELAQKIEAAGRLNAPKGLGWLLRDSAVSREAKAIVTPITAASHMSIITCTPPSRHGVVSNLFLKDGQRVSGFAVDPATEPFWLAARRQGKTVLSLVYPGVDGATERRRADLGLGYPLEALLPAPMTLNWRLSSLAAAVGWALPKELKAQKGLKEASLDVVLNPETQETRKLFVLVAGIGTPNTELIVASTKNITKGSLGRLAVGDPGRRFLDLFFLEERPDSGLVGVKRRVMLRAYAPDAETIRLYVSRATYNQAYPESLRRRLDALDLVWPDDGIKDESIPLSPTEWVESKAITDRFISEVARVVVPETKPDIVLFYQPLIDSLGHEFASILPQPFDPKNADEVTQAFTTGFGIIDANLSSLLTTVGEASPVMAMGDHGMDAVFKGVNVAALLGRGGVQDGIILSGGDLLLVYPKTRGVATDVEQAQAVGQRLRDKLRQTQYEGRQVLGFSAARRDYAAVVPDEDYRREWPYGEAVYALAAREGLVLQFKPASSELFVDAPRRGSHGKMVKADMTTMLIAKGKGIGRQDLGPLSLLDAVPTFSKLLGIRPPKDCIGKSLF
jgi:hypothetical protein